MPGKLSIVATPIGNLGDLTFRAQQTLEACDMIICEDTRVTSKLLAAYQISKSLRSLHERSTDAQLQTLLREIQAGKHVCYVSDAGTPGVNDPGGKLVAAAYDADIAVEPIPGVSALTTGISVCGFPMDDFVYAGFAPHKKGRQTFFTDLAARAIPTIFFESTHRIEKTLEALKQNLSPERLIFIGRELTKMHEHLYRGTVMQVWEELKRTSLKGEFILIVGPQKKR